LLSKYYVGDQIKDNEMGGACGMCGGEKKCMHGCSRKPEGKRPPGMLRHYEDNIEILKK
jgi:hypothetical protein